MAVNATAIWRVRPGGNNANGGGYDASISGAGTDYSQQNAAQATGAHGTATGTATFTDATANAFATAMVGNCIQIVSGTGFTPGFYFVVGFTSASTVTLDRSPGTGTVAVWNLGGGWAEPFTNVQSTGPLVPGNTVYVLGSGVPNPASYTYDYSYSGSFLSITAGSNSDGRITIANDPMTPGYKLAPDTTGGMPVIQAANGFLYNASGYHNYVGLYFVAGGVNLAGFGVIFDGPATAIGCVVDQFSNDITGFRELGIYGCEVFSSIAPGSAGGNPAYFSTVEGASAINCNLHDTVAGGVYMGTGNVLECIIAKCLGNGIEIDNAANPINVKNCTVDDNIGNGIEITAQSSVNDISILNNIISNHTQSGKAGTVVDSGTAAVNDTLAYFFDYNVYYNNTTDVSGIDYGPHDTHGGANPYVNSAIENYTLA